VNSETVSPYPLNLSIHQQSADHGYDKEYRKGDSGPLDPERVTVGIRSHWPGALTKWIVTGYR